jgi:cytochrome b6-f complex iron-sulfur subunit
MTEEEKQPEPSDAAAESENKADASAGAEGAEAGSKPGGKSDTKSKIAAARAAGGNKDTQSKIAAARAGGKGGTQSKIAAARAAKGAGGASKLAAARAGGAAKAKQESERGTAAGTKGAPPKKSAGPPKKPKAQPQPETRRSFVTWAGTAWVSFTAACTAMLAGSARFMFPNWLREPPSKFKIGSPDEYPAGTVATKWKAQFGIWVVNTEYNGKQEIYALRTVCTHLGCTPNWLEGEQKFKCPCHGSGFRISGINFEGPAPRPLERYAIRLADDGQLEVEPVRCEAPQQTCRQSSPPYKTSLQTHPTTLN